MTSLSHIFRQLLRDANNLIVPDSGGDGDGAGPKRGSTAVENMLKRTENIQTRGREKFHMNARQFSRARC
jgi:hypothetical protein